MALQPCSNALKG